MFFSMCLTGAYARLKKTFHKQKSNRWLIATKKLQTNKGGDASLIQQNAEKQGATHVRSIPDLQVSEHPADSEHSD